MMLVDFLTQHWTHRIRYSVLLAKNTAWRSHDRLTEMMIGFIIRWTTKSIYSDWNNVDSIYVWTSEILVIEL